MAVRPHEHGVLRRLLLVLERVLHAPPAWRFLAVLLGAFGVMLGAAVLSGILTHWASAPDHPVSFDDGFWWALTHLFDGGTVAADTGLALRFLGVIITIFGLVAVALLTGAFASACMEALERIRSGDLPTFERNHLLFLGFGPSAGVVLRELSASGPRRVIVIVSAQRREIVEERIRDYLPPGSPGLDIILRSGDPTSPSAVVRGAARRATAVVVLPEVEPSAGEGADSIALRSVIAARRVLAGREVPLLVESAGANGRALLGLRAGPGHLGVVQARDLHARLLAQTVRQPGIFEIARTILGSGAHGVFARPAAAHAGATFDDAHAAAGGGVLIGVVRDGCPELCPDGSLVLRPDDRLLFFGASGAPARVDGALPAGSVELVPLASRPPDQPLDLLVLRASPELGRVLAALDRHERVRALVLGNPDSLGALAAALDPARLGLGRTTVELRAGDPSDGKTLDALLDRRWDVALQLAAPVSAALEAHADADSLLTQLHVKLLRRPGAGAERALVEVRGPEAQRIARGLGLGAPFVLAREIVGLILAREIHALATPGCICHDLLDDVAASVELRAIAPREPRSPALTFAHLEAAARRRGEIALGVLERGADGPAPRLLPPRGERLVDAEALQVIVLTSAEIRAGGAVDAVPPR